MKQLLKGSQKDVISSDHKCRCPLIQINISNPYFEDGGGKANTHCKKKKTTHEEVLFVKQVLPVFLCLDFAVEGRCSE
jgi:hypothetical protein